VSAPRFEIVRSDAAQPWHFRFIASGRVVASSETYARKIGAQRAIEAMGRAFSAWGMARLDPEWLSVAQDRDATTWVAIPVRYIDERTA
jgi:uncharacterized protein YegP (UPF0339 family)